MDRRTQHSETEFESFVVDDGTGTAYVDPANADVVLTHGDVIPVDSKENPPEFIREYVERETSLDPVGGHKRWYTEYRLDVAGTPASPAGPTRTQPRTWGRR